MPELIFLINFIIMKKTAQVCGFAFNLLRNMIWVWMVNYKKMNYLYHSLAKSIYHPLDHEKIITSFQHDDPGLSLLRFFT